MSAKPLTWAKRFRYAWLTALAYLIYGFFRVMPIEMASGLGGSIMRRVGPLMKKQQSTARQNLAAAFPEKTEQEREKIIGDMWDNIGRVIAEYPHLHRIWKQVDYPGTNHFAEARDKGGPTIFFGGHLSNWEISPIAAKASGLPIHLVYRKPNNPWVDNLLRYARSAAAVGQIVKGREGAREIVSVLKKGGAIGMLIDQKLNEGIPVPFFGRDAMTAEAIGLFALKLNCALYPVQIERTNGARFKLTSYPKLEIVNTGDKDKDVREIMLRINEMLEGWVRQRPEQWLWIHRRWPKN